MDEEVKVENLECVGRAAGAVAGDAIEGALGSGGVGQLKTEVGQKGAVDGATHIASTPVAYDQAVKNEPADLRQGQPKTQMDSGPPETAISNEQETYPTPASLPSPGRIPTLKITVDDTPSSGVILEDISDEDRDVSDGMQQRRRSQSVTATVGEDGLVVRDEMESSGVAETIIKPDVDLDEMSIIANKVSDETSTNAMNKCSESETTEASQQLLFAMSDDEIESEAMTESSTSANELKALDLLLRPKDEMERGDASDVFHTADEPQSEMMDMSPQSTEAISDDGMDVDDTSDNFESGIKSDVDTARPQSPIVIEDEDDEISAGGMNEGVEVVVLDSEDDEDMSIPAPKFSSKSSIADRKKSASESLLQTTTESETNTSTMELVDLVSDDDTPVDSSTKTLNFVLSAKKKSTSQPRMEGLNDGEGDDEILKQRRSSGRKSPGVIPDDDEMDEDVPASSPSGPSDSSQNDLELDASSSAPIGPSRTPSYQRQEILRQYRNAAKQSAQTATSTSPQDITTTTSRSTAGNNKIKKAPPSRRNPARAVKLEQGSPPAPEAAPIVDVIDVDSESEETIATAEQQFTRVKRERSESSTTVEGPPRKRTARNVAVKREASPVITVPDHDGLSPEEQAQWKRRNQAFDRMVVQLVLGGGTQNTFPKPGSDTITRYGDRGQYAAMKRAWNPNLPHHPLEPGSIVICGGISHLDFLKKPFPLFVQRKPREWLYVGHYTCKVEPQKELSWGQLKETSSLASRTWINRALRNPDWGEWFFGDLGASRDQVLGMPLVAIEELLDELTSGAGSENKIGVHELEPQEYDDALLKMLEQVAAEPETIAKIEGIAEKGKATRKRNEALKLQAANDREEIGVSPRRKKAGAATKKATAAGKKKKKTAAVADESEDDFEDNSNDYSDDEDYQ
ncbi:uncharacterized protein EV422DRAFT_339362 [Fimicolochytrium jonesii]|uniref:uncharacterized protein n=1 Tax=Fimicolochytrium jonesii TaxID=1396493 RepID=UPI0022FDDB5D|nr:uncharacterized protein EV422DRAFT_339362 [Fimicolochytrium jonesii]KAI8815878.1 hypothetical protein EV422DRAFT_339362 [Fimicolochytrium jonesii]